MESIAELRVSEGKKWVEGLSNGEKEAYKGPVHSFFDLKKVEETEWRMRLSSY